MLLVLLGYCELVERSRNWKTVFLLFFAGCVEAGLSSCQTRVLALSHAWHLGSCLGGDHFHF